MNFYPEKDISLCGLACVLCREEACPGCKARGCTKESDCSIYLCARNKKLDGCYACSEFPCNENMLQNPRIRAFNLYAKEHGKQALLDCLARNQQDGMVYHKADGLKGDYDVPETVDDILQLIEFGIYTPYFNCPSFETEHFILRLVQETDASDLLSCYADEKSWPNFNADTCTGDFHITLETDMNNCIKAWIDSFSRKDFIRFSILDRQSGHAVGTIEMFGRVGSYKVSRGILRLDLASDYETPETLQELFTLCIKEFYQWFSVDLIVTKAVPNAEKRVKVLKELGFTEYPFPDREHYFGLSLTISASFLL